MTLCALIRHAPTAWNAARRIQGQCDVPLLLEAARDWRVPDELAGFRWVASPLARAVETARRLGIAAPAIEARLGEMAWGEWEGFTLAELRRRHGAAMAENEAAGLDFRPPGGESPREVQARVAPFLAAVARCGRATAAVTHRGVIRAVLALATGWDMRGKSPHRLDPAAAHLFRLDRDGSPAVARLNIPLVPR